jgi:hypothetical protein
VAADVEETSVARQAVVNPSTPLPQHHALGSVSAHGRPEQPDSSVCAGTGGPRVVATLAP